MAEKDELRQRLLAASLVDGIIAINRQMRQVPMPQGASPERIAVLSLLDAHGRVPVTQLARLANVRPSTMSRMTGDLVTKGLARKFSYRHDARGVLIGITPKGKRLCEAAKRRSADYIGSALTDLSSEHVEALEELVRRLDQVAVDGPAGEAADD